MIKRGYYLGNEKLMLSTDFERAYQGYESPLKSAVDIIKN